jgi:hypothetical protein
MKWSQDTAHFDSINLLAASLLSNEYQGALSLWVKLPGRETDHSAPSSAEVKECMELYLHPKIRLHGVVLS